MAGARDDLDQWRGGPGLRRVNLIHQRKTPSAAVELGRGGSRVSIEGWRFAERQGNPNTELTGNKRLSALLFQIAKSPLQFFDRALHIRDANGIDGLPRQITISGERGFKFWLGARRPQKQFSGKVARRLCHGVFPPVSTPL